MPCNAAYHSMVHKEYYSNEQTTIGFDRHNAFICKFKMRFLLVKVESFYRTNCFQKQLDALKTQANQSKIHFLKTESNECL